jgi:hypothetical protein
MGPGGSSIQDEPAERAAGGVSDEGLARREPYLRRVLAAFEAGHLEAYEYTRRVLAINAATSTDQMQAVVDERSGVPVGEGGSVVPPGFDAVDLARLHSAQRAQSRTPTTRYVTLAVVFVLFAVLIGIGMWLATHVHGTALSGGATSGVAIALVTPGWR